MLSFNKTRANRPEQGFNVAFDIEKINRARGDTPLLGKAITVGKSTKLFGLCVITIGSSKTTPDFKKTYARQLVDEIETQAVDQAARQALAHYTQVAG